MKKVLKNEKRDYAADSVQPFNNKKRGLKANTIVKFSDTDESASDGYDVCDRRLLIQAESDCSDSVVTLNSDDATESWMKNKTEKRDNDQQLCQIDIGNDCYVVGKEFTGKTLIHTRQYERHGDGTIFLTKKGIGLDLEKWKKVQCKQEWESFSDCAFS